MKTHIVTKMFPSNLIDFQPDGRLFPTLEIMAATIIMCHNEMKKKYTMTNPIVFKVHELFRMDYHLNTEQLRSLSIQIKDGFLNNNNTTKVVKKASNIMDALNHNSSSTANINRTMTSLVSMMEDL